MQEIKIEPIDIDESNDSIVDADEVYDGKVSDLLLIKPLFIYTSNVPINCPVIINSLCIETCTTG